MVQEVNTNTHLWAANQSRISLGIKMERAQYMCHRIPKLKSTPRGKRTLRRLQEGTTTKRVGN
ncbi:hypothetical protein FS749_005894 [Ceratobasidium sp. UAMH 11750]|nr:hypothetical protein FS749_005894 [Ceratobasidium sp. UAMH 11750]